MLEVNPDAHLALVKLLPSFYEAMSKSKNMIRDVRNFCNQNSVLFFDGHAAMDNGDYLPTLFENDGIEANSILHYIVEAQFPSFFVLERKSIDEKEDTGNMIDE